MDHSRWLWRPLDKIALQYAAEDIAKICLLYYKLVEEGYINQDVLARQSASYIALHAVARPNRGDRYQRHGLLPLALLTEMPSGTKVRCQGCKRDLPLSAFAQGNTVSHRNGYCFVCRAVDTKANFGGQAYIRGPGRRF
jgi:exonuclease 3'-5' domain-containing protein 1